jgi:hypothetical protein
MQHKVEDGENQPPNNQPDKPFLAVFKLGDILFQLIHTSLQIRQVNPIRRIFQGLKASRDTRFPVPTIKVTVVLLNGTA